MHACARACVRECVHLSWILESLSSLCFAEILDRESNILSGMSGDGKHCYTPIRPPKPQPISANRTFKSFASATTLELKQIVKD